jgi:hypothetical protein
MIIDYKKNPSVAVQYDVVDAETGGPLEYPYFYADDEQGYYLYHPRNEGGCRYLWDSRTREPLPANPLDRDTPDEFIEVAWARVDQKILIRPRVKCVPSPTA